MPAPQNISRINLATALIQYTGKHICLHGRLALELGLDGDIALLCAAGVEGGHDLHNMKLLGAVCPEISAADQRFCHIRKAKSPGIVGVVIQ